MLKPSYKKGQKFNKVCLLCYYQYVVVGWLHVKVEKKYYLSSSQTTGFPYLSS